MERTTENYFKVGIGSLFLSVIPAALFASLYSTFRTGFSQYKVETFDVFAFWNDTPFGGGFYDQNFQIVGGVFAAMALICPIAGMLLAFPKKLDSHGSAQWADHSHLKKAGYLKKHNKIIGTVLAKTTMPKKDGHYFTSAKQPHILVSAPTRAGKGVSVVIPTLLTYEGSVVALDVKGELFDLTSRARRKMGDRIYRFAPYDEEGRTHRYNPLDGVVAASPLRRYTEARRLAANLIIAKSKGAEGFVDGSRDLFAAGILHVISLGTPTIAAVYDLFTSGGDRQELFSRLAAETDSREAKSIFNIFGNMEHKLIGNYTSVLEDGGLRLWADTYVRASTSSSDFDLSSLRRTPTTIYMCVSPNDLQVLAPLMRLLFQQLVSTMQAALPKEDEIFPVLYLLDEFKDLGRMEAIESAITTIAGYNGRFMFIVQTLANISDKYGKEGRENIMGNCGVQVFMATSDTETPEYISRAIGDFTRKSRTKSWSTRELTGGTIQERTEGARLIRPEEIRLFPDDDILIIVRGQNPIRLKKGRYYEDKIFKKIFEKQSGDHPIPPTLDLDNYGGEPQAAMNFIPDRQYEASEALYEKSEAIEEMANDFEQENNSAAPSVDEAEQKEIEMNNQTVKENNDLLDAVTLALAKMETQTS